MHYTVINEDLREVITFTSDDYMRDLCSLAEIGHQTKFRNKKAAEYFMSRKRPKLVAHKVTKKVTITQILCNLGIIKVRKKAHGLRNKKQK